MSRSVLKKIATPQPGPILVIRMNGREMGVSLISQDGVHTEHTIGDHQELLRTIAVLVGEKGIAVRPRAILVAGSAERFSDSRSVATIANTLAFAWDIPIAVATRLPVRLDEKTLKPFFSRNQSAIRVRYSGKPHITIPRKKQAQQSQSFKKTVAARP